jgi:hypothetical protein
MQDRDERRALEMNRQFLISYKEYRIKSGNIPIAIIKVNYEDICGLS